MTVISTKVAGDRIGSAEMNALLNKVQNGTDFDVNIRPGTVASAIYPTGFTQTRVQNAINTINSTGGEVILPPGTYTMATNTTFSTKVGLRRMNGAILSVQTGITVTINGPFISPLSQAFSLVGTGVVAFGSGAVKEFYPQWWGAKGDGVTDDRAAIQAAIDAVPNSGGTVYFQMADYYIGSALTVPALTGGASQAAVRLWAARGTRFLCNVSSGSYVLTIALNAIRGPIIDGIRFVWQSGITSCIGFTGSLTGGVRLTRCDIVGFTTIGFDDSGSRLNDFIADDCAFVSCGVGTKAYSVGISEWRGCAWNTCTSGLQVGPSSVHYLFACNMSGCTKNVDYADAASNNVTISILGGSFDVAGGGNPMFVKSGAGQPTFIGMAEGFYIQGTGAGAPTYFDFSNHGRGVYSLRNIFMNQGGLSGTLDLGNALANQVVLDGLWFNGTLAIVLNGVSQTIVAGDVNSYISHLATNFPLQFTITVGASPSTWTNLTGIPVMVTVQGGTVSKVEHLRAGTSIDIGATGGTVFAAHRDSIVITYTVAPTVKGIPMG